MQHMMPSLGALRLVLSIVLFLLGLLAVVKPPSYSFWKLSIIIMEGGHWLVLPLLLSAWLSFRSGQSGRIAGQIFLGAALLYSVTVIRAYATAHKLELEFAERWSNPSPPVNGFRRASTLSFLDLFRGIDHPKPVVTTYPYAKREGRELRLDFYPALGAAKPAPCVVLVHGGGWDGGARNQLPDLNAWLSAEGYAVASLEYRLAPKDIYPAPVEDMRSALDWMRSHAGELGIDATRFVLMGRSAGGQIALQAAYLRPDASIKGVIAFYAPADMVFGYSLPTNPLIMDSRQLMVNYLGSKYEDKPEAYVASSPVEHLTATSPPTLILHGRADVLVSYQHTVHMRAKLKPLGVKHFEVDLPWAAHGFDYVFRGPGSQISLYFIERFLAEVTR